MKEQMFPNTSKYISGVIDQIMQHPDYFAGHNGLELWAAYVDNNHDIERTVAALNQEYVNDKVKEYVLKIYKKELIANVVKSLRRSRNELNEYKVKHPKNYQGEALTKSYLLAKVDLLTEIGVLLPNNAKMLVDIILEW